MIKKILAWGGVSFMIFFVAFRPGAATDVVRTLGNTLIDIGAVFGRFFS